MITKRQLSMIIINAIMVKVLITFPHSMLKMAGNAAWISVIYCTVIAAVFFGITTAVYKFDGNVIELSGKIGGRAMQIVVGLAVFAVMGLNFFPIIRVFPEIIRLVLLKQTYAELIGLLFVVCIVLGAYCGIESIARVHEMFIPIAVGVSVLFVLLLIPEFHIDNIFPIFGKGIYNLFVENISFLSLFSDLLMLNILIPYTQNAADYKKTGTQAILVSGIGIFLVGMVYCLSYVYPMSEQYIAPVYQLERLIRLSSFLARFEAAFQFIWSISIMLYGALYVALMGEVWRTTFGLKESKPLLPTITTVLLGASLIPNTLLDIIDVEAVINKWLYIPVFVIPFVIGIMFHVKHYE